MSNCQTKSVRYCDGQFFTAGSYIPVFTPDGDMQAAEFVKLVCKAEKLVQRKLSVSELVHLGDVVCTLMIGQ